MNYAGVAETALKEFGRSADTGNLPVGDAALYLAQIDMPERGIEPYLHHLAELRDKTAQAASGAADADSLHRALHDTIAGQYGYRGDHDSYDHLDNASLMRVIDRRKGLPIALAILYVDAGIAAGIDIAALNFPGHVVMKITSGGQNIIVDPYQPEYKLQAADLRQLIKKIMGPNAELSNTYYEPMDRREMLLRLQNNIKSRLIDGEDYEGALSVVRRMQWIAPRDSRLMFDAGILLAKTGRVQDAIASLDSFIAHTGNARERHQAALIIQQLKQMIQ